ncbi:MAG: class I SAM-dependent methyltransferase [Planctomycetes bacterium]|nr:class I SAM-dependent methyltransferase [Planctomycetota bacterium]
MVHPHVYHRDLAYIHDVGFGDFARGSAPGLLNLLNRAGITEGRIVDLGCGSGIWAREVANAGFEVLGVDISPAMIDLARQRVPEADFHLESFLQFQPPPCRAVTALGEVFNYLFDTENSLLSLQKACKRVFDALPVGGVLIFDVAEPGRCRGLKQAFQEGQDWTCLVEYQHDESHQQLVRRIVTFRKTIDSYVRHEEMHCLQLYDQDSITQMLQDVGYRVRTVRSYGDYPLPDRVVGFIAAKS